MKSGEEDDLSAPNSERVAARAVVLAAVSCRGLIENEKDVDERGAENVRSRIVSWLEKIGASNELEPAEAGLLSKPVGSLDRSATVDASWRSEGLVVLAWALHYTTLPPVHVLCEP